MSEPGAKALEEHIANGGLSYPFPEDDPEYGQFLAQAWSSGYLAGTSERPPADVWVPVPLRWRHVRSWDLIVGTDSAVWAVTKIGSSYGPGVEVTAICGSESFTDDVDPDDAVNVLVPVTERDAVELCRDELGARLAGRRSTDQRTA